MMKRIDAILADERYINSIKNIEEKEVDRIYCRHGYDHLLSVARIAYILYLEMNIEGMSGDSDLRTDGDIKEMIYAAALLHDIGRYTRYEKTMNHREAGPIVAEPILRSAGFDEAEIQKICSAIRLHGDEPEKYDTLAGILYRADKLSRNCFSCGAYESCNWPESRKNRTVMF